MFCRRVVVKISLPLPRQGLEPPAARRVVELLRRDPEIEPFGQAVEDERLLVREGEEIEEQAEVGPGLGGRVAQGPEIAEDVLRGGLGDGLVGFPLPDEIGPAVAAGVEAGRVLEARAAVVRPEIDVAELGDLAHQPPHELGVVPADGGMGQGQRETGTIAPERVVDAGPAKIGIFLEDGRRGPSAAS